MSRVLMFLGVIATICVQFMEVDVSMSFIGAAISAASGLVSGVVGGVKAGKAQKQLNAMVDGELAHATNQFNKDYYTDATQRSDTQALLGEMRNRLSVDRKQGAATAAVMGSTPEAIAASKQQTSDTIAQATGTIAASNDRYKDNVLNRYNAQRSNLMAQKFGSQAQSAESWGNMAEGGAKTMASGIGGLAEHFFPTA